MRVRVKFALKDSVGVDPPGAPPPKAPSRPPPIRPSLTSPPPMPPPPQRASGPQLVGGVVGVQNRGVAPPLGSRVGAFTETLGGSEDIPRAVSPPALALGQPLRLFLLSGVVPGLLLDGRPGEGTFPDGNDVGLATTASGESLKLGPLAAGESAKGRRSSGCSPPR